MNKDLRIAQLEKELSQLRNSTDEQEVVDGNPEMTGLNGQSTEADTPETRIAVSGHVFRKLVEQATDPICILKGENMIIEVANDAMLLVWNVGKEVLGKSLWHIHPGVQEQIFAGLLLDVLKNGITHHGKEEPAYFKRADGTQEIIYFNFTYQPYQEDDGTITGVMVLAKNVTEQVIARKKVEESEARYKSLIASAPIAIGVFMGRDLVIENPNQQFIDIVGKGPEIVGKRLADVMPELVIHGQPYLKILDDVFTTGKTYQSYGDPVIVIKNGVMHEGFYDINYVPLFDADGDVYGIMDIAIDVTDRIISSKKIKESQEQFSLLANNIQNLAWMADADGWIFWYNNRWYEYTGTSPEEMEGWGWQKVHDPEQLPFVMERWQGSIHSGQPFEMTFPLKGADNKFRPFLTRVEPIRNQEGKLIRWIGTNTDITEQIETQALLEYRKALLEAHNESSVDGVLLVDAKGKMLSYNKRFIEIWNMPQHIVDEQDDESALEFAMSQLVYPQQFIDKVIHLYTHPEEISHDELEFKDGKIIERHGYPVIAPDGSNYAWSWTFRDITVARNADTAIRLSEQNFRQLADLMPDKVTNTDAEGKVTYYNQNWLDYTGLSFEELKDWGWLKSIHPDDLDKTIPLWQQALATGTPLETQDRILNRDGEYRWHLSRVTPIKDDHGKITKWISATTEIQEQKEQTEKLEAAVRERTLELIEKNIELQNINKEMEAFTYVSSHDLQEPLRKIQTFADRILQKEIHNLSDNGKVMFQRMQVASLRMQTLIQDLLAFSRLSTTERKFEYTNLNIIIEEVKHELADTIAEKQATIEIQEMCAVNIIPFQFHQLMHNLIGNALKFSKPDVPPHIKISFQTIQYSKPDIPKLRPYKEYCHISITDNGIGFEKEFNERIFEVFQRLHSKLEYAGTGIGLAIVKKIVENHNGIITATSELGKGATFDIYILAD